MRTPRGAVFPAGYDDVVAVNATAAGIPVTEGEIDVRGSVLQSSAIDVAAPTYDAVTTSVNGGTCVLPTVATSWAAAEVSGVRGPDAGGVPRRQRRAGRRPAAATPPTARPPTRQC